MPTQKPRLTKTEDQEYRARLLKLEKIGIQIGSLRDSAREPPKLTLEQIDDQLATVHELPGGQLAVVVFAKMIVLTPGILITALEMMTPWDGRPLSLDDPEDNEFYADITRGLPSYRPTLLNKVLKSKRPLSRCQVEGALIAYGWGSAPPNWSKKAPVTVELFLRDDRSNELSFEFRACLDCGVTRKYERQRQERSKSTRSRKRVSIFKGHMDNLEVNEATHHKTPLRNYGTIKQTTEAAKPEIDQPR